MIAQKVININMKFNPVKVYLNKKNESTRLQYERYIKKFFKVEDIEELDMRIIGRITFIEAENYVLELKQTGLSSATIHARIIPLKNLYSYLLSIPEFEKQLPNLNPFANIEVKVQSKSGESFTEREIRKLITVAKPADKTFYELAVRTGIRKNALLSLTIGNFIKLKGYYLIKVIDKNNKEHRKSIPEILWNTCVNRANKDGKIFDITSKTVNNRLNANMKKIGLTKQEIELRGLTPHSLRKSTAVLGMNLTGGDLHKVSQHMLHSSVDTTNNIYLKSQQNHSQDLSLNLLGKKEVKEEVQGLVEKMDKKDIAEKLGNLDDNTLYQLLSALN